MHCSGEILDTVQTSGLFKDSKTFVDMSMKEDPESVLKEFHKLPKDPGADVLRGFVDKHFNPAGSDATFVTPEDWEERPAFIDTIENEDLQKWAHHLNTVWKSLFKRTSPDIELHPDRHTLLPLPHNFAIPGGRFREMFYWDSYWAMKGMLLCGMAASVKGMLRNFICLIKWYGYVPNYARTYSLGRSQPPLLASMVEQYVVATGDEQFVSEAMEHLETEYQFWMQKRTIQLPSENGKVFRLQRYINEDNAPIPESYKEHLDTFRHIHKHCERRYTELRAACESGWDYSSRWLARSPDGKVSSLSSIRTSQIIPVDLNSVMFMMEKSMSRLCLMQGNCKRKLYFWEQAKVRVVAMEKLLWNEAQGTWFDYDIEAKQHVEYYNISCGFPLFAGCHGITEKEKANKEAAFLSYLQSVGALSYPGGIPTSFDATGEQWDFPNAWPPLVHVMVMGLYNSSHETARQVATTIAKQWIRANYFTWKTTGHMFEKYDAEKSSSPGGQGEYEVQLGFAWTNGVVLDFIHQFGDELNDVTKPN